MAERHSARAHGSVAVGLVRASSTEAQDHSTADQSAEIRRWCEAEGRDLGRIFEDDGVSGSILDRPGLSDSSATLRSIPRVGRTVVVRKRNRLA